MEIKPTSEERNTGAAKPATGYTNPRQSVREEYENSACYLPRRAPVNGFRLFGIAVRSAGRAPPLREGGLAENRLL